ncbi:hypothetical protein [Sorangium sp. So ce233]|uniref:hypothetical protein n=1 Tax=Sorangium sp. So ce233 TaxID=3133290 RepID=UPI003F6367F7
MGGARRTAALAPDHPVSGIDWPMAIPLGASALAAVVAAVDTLWKRRIQHDGLRLAAAGKPKAPADSEPPPSGEPASDPAPVAVQPRPAAGARRAGQSSRGSLPSIPEGVAWRAEVDARIADLRAEMLREVGEAKADARAAQRHAERAHRMATRLRELIERYQRDIAERLATIEGWMDGWFNRGGGGAGPGSRRRGG